MSTFVNIQKKVQDQFKQMVTSELYLVGMEKGEMFQAYLNALPESERQHHTCNCCKSFFNHYAGMVTIVDNDLVTLWDFDISDPVYKDVPQALSELVRSKFVDRPFLSDIEKLGTEFNRQTLPSGEVIRWGHFAVNLPKAKIYKSSDSIDTTIGNMRATRDVFKRSLETLTIAATETVLDLIDANPPLYRGKEYEAMVLNFLKHQKNYARLHNQEPKVLELYYWKNCKDGGRIRNTAIGTLLIDISEGMDLEQAVRRYEAVVAPANYKRSTAVVTAGMIAKAKKTIEDLGLTSALERRFATLEDISVNNVLFADRNARKKMNSNVFDDLMTVASSKSKKEVKGDEITIDDFISQVLPKVDSVEVLFENKHAGNLVSLIAPVDPEAKPLFKWSNRFSWSYCGDLADSVTKQRVKAAGGTVDGYLRNSLSWNYKCDLDLHMREPAFHIHFRDKLSPMTKGALDIDQNAGGNLTDTPVENIIYPHDHRMKEGQYILQVHNFRRRTDGTGFVVEMEFDGNVHTFVYEKAVREGEYITVAEFTYSRKEGIKITKSLPSTTASRKLWNLDTQSWQRASLVCLSPNYWDDNSSTGNKHYFFMLQNCINEERARGFYNEFLRSDLREFSKVMEVVGSKMKTEECPNQLSGLGFSSTKPDSLTIRVKGEITKTFKVIF